MRLGLVGATGAVGRTMLSVLAERRVPVGELRAFASSRSAGSKLETPWGEVEVEELAAADPSGLDAALFSAGADRSRDHAPRFSSAGAVVIDNSSAFRTHPSVPLVVTGVNDDDLEWHQGIVANPNCTTMVLAMAAAPLHRAARLRRVVATSYQSVSGSGKKGMEELTRQVPVLGSSPGGLVEGGWEDPGSSVYVRPIAWNVLPFAGSAGEDGYTDEEWKLVRESRKILDAPDLPVEPTCVRVPVMVGHGVAAALWFERPLEVEEARDLLTGVEGLDLWEDAVPTPLDSAGRDEVLVGRLRPTIGEPGGVNLWVVGDNLRKGAALNAIQILERLLERDLLRSA